MLSAVSLDYYRLSGCTIYRMSQSPRKSYHLRNEHNTQTVFSTVESAL